MKSNDVIEQPPSNGRPSNARGRDASGTARKIEQSIAYMMQHLHEPLQVATLAATANTSPSHFFALFKRLTGRPPICYFIRLRMQRACELLQDESLHVKEVAACLGYDDPFYFSRIFKAVNRVAPTEYRLAHGRQGKRPAACAPAKEWSPGAVCFSTRADKTRESGVVPFSARNALAQSSPSESTAPLS
jgi:AraC-like DNA-binding protein